MGAIASQITSLTIIYWIVYSDADQRKHQRSASLAFDFLYRWSSAIPLYCDDLFSEVFAVHTPEFTPERVVFVSSIFTFQPAAL